MTKAGLNSELRNDPNGTISERTKVPIKLIIPSVAFLLSCAFWIARVERQLTDSKLFEDRCEQIIAERDVGDRFKGADADRWIERIQWAWQAYAHSEDLGTYPEVPPWRDGVHWAPSTIKTHKDR